MCTLMQLLLLIISLQHRMWQWHLTYLKRMKRQSPDIMLRFETINVAHQVRVNFTDKTLVFIDTRTNQILQRYLHRLCFCSAHV